MRKYVQIHVHVVEKNMFVPCIIQDKILSYIFAIKHQLKHVFINMMLMITIKPLYIYSHWYFYFQSYLDMCHTLVDRSLYYFTSKGRLTAREPMEIETS